jgi:protein-tyrosine-phosphatase
MTAAPGLPQVLFVCVRNAGRSQMAAALLDHHAAGRVRGRSAGSAPAETIDPAVIAVMEELGLDLTREFPKPLTTDAVQAADVVITMGCGDACPIFPGRPPHRRGPPPSVTKSTAASTASSPNFPRTLSRRRMGVTRATPRGISVWPARCSVLYCRESVRILLIIVFGLGKTGRT